MQHNWFNAPDCESGKYGFESRRTPHFTSRWSSSQAAVCKTALGWCKSNTGLQFLNNYDCVTPHYLCGMNSKPQSSYAKYLEVREEILKHKWIESEKANNDIGFEKALTDWIKTHRVDWVKENFYKNS